MDLFDQNVNGSNYAQNPLAERMRPQNLTEFVGQKHLIAPNKVLQRLIHNDQLSSMIFYGPPGSGKTTLARIIAKETKANFTQLNAVTSGVAQIRDVIKQATDARKFYHKQTILFIDEIHRFNKSQQDALLPAVEKGVIILIGATTENPYFEIISPLISRSRVFMLEALTQEDILVLLKRAIVDKERGLGQHNLKVAPDALKHFAQRANGDARNALSALEIAFLALKKEEPLFIDLEQACEAMQKKALVYEKDGDNHYDTISAFIKSMRGSDPDATLYYLSRMLSAGEDVKFIARRIIIHAAEDVGLANPQALVIATNAALAVERVGMPEGRIILASAALYIALSPKCRGVVDGIDQALKFYNQDDYRPIPSFLADASYQGAQALQKGQGYVNPLYLENEKDQQQYLPKGLEHLKFYHGVQLRQSKVEDSFDEK